MSMRDVTVAIVGGGQAGLAIGYELQRRNIEVVILEAASSVGESWRARWDSLCLFTPVGHSSLPAMPFPGAPHAFPTKDHVAHYLEAYAARFALPVQLNQRVVSVATDANGYQIGTTETTWWAKNVVVATGPFHTPFIPAWANHLSPHVVQLHSNSYRNPTQLPAGRILVVGGGNSGTQIAEELAHTYPVTLAIGRRSPSVPLAIAQQPAFWHAYMRIAPLITVDTPLGRVMSRQDVLFGTSLRRLAAHPNITLVGRAWGAADNRVFSKGSGAVEIASIVWATGFKSHYPWLHVPVLDHHGAPIHHHGVTTSAGLYFVGLHWQVSATSAILGGVGHDAAMIAHQIAA